MTEYPIISKTPAESCVTMTELVLPSQINLLNNLLGGQMMHMMDIAGSLVCKRHSGFENATVAVDGMEFKHPVPLGSIITINAKMIWAGRSSMKVRLIASCEDVVNKTSIITNTATFTFVALDKNARPAVIPPLNPVTDEEKEDFLREQTAYEERKGKH